MEIKGSIEKWKLCSKGKVKTNDKLAWNKITWNSSNSQEVGEESSDSEPLPWILLAATL